MAKNKKMVDPTYKVVHYPLAYTMTLHSTTAEYCKEKLPTLVPVLADLVKFDSPKAQKLAIKQLRSHLPQLEGNDETRDKLALFLLECYLDLGMSFIKAELYGMLSKPPLAPAVVAFINSVARHDLVLYNPDTPLSHVEHIFTNYITLVQLLKADVTKEERTRILNYTFGKFETALKKQLPDTEAYNVAVITEYLSPDIMIAHRMTTCLNFISFFLPKYLSQPTSADAETLLHLSQSTLDFTRRQLVDRDILTLCGIVYWLSASTYIRLKIGPYPDKTEIAYLNTLISQGSLNLTEIGKQPLAARLKTIDKTPNTLCLIRGFIRVIQNLDNFFLPAIESMGHDMTSGPYSYFDYVLNCCEIEQVNCKIYALTVCCPRIDPEIVPRILAVQRDGVRGPDQARAVDPHRL